MLWILYKLQPGGSFTEIGCIVIDACFYFTFLIGGVLAYIQAKGEEKMKKRKYKIIFENAVGALVDMYAEDALFVLERDERTGRLIEPGFEVPTKQEGINYLRTAGRG